MIRNTLIGLALLYLFSQPVTGQSGEKGEKGTVEMKGQFSAYTHFNPDNIFSLWNGARYIPQLNYEFTQKERMFDLEASVNLYGNRGVDFSDTSAFNGNLKPYRYWVRYSTEQFEMRAGLQKINFGSASLLRPLMWFDQVDPRDPLKLTDGVWGVLARYYFLNNANIWFWGLYGNEKRKGWESFGSNKSFPEFGGRVQLPVPRGEAGLTYHHRTADCSKYPGFSSYNEVNENRFGFDLRLDVVVGCWMEASWSIYAQDLGTLKNQEIFNAGIDYTFGIGNGLSAIYEHLIASADEEAFGFKNLVTFSLLNISYPVGMFDHVSAILYYDWTNNRAYNFITWQRQFNNFSIFLMGYLNPDEYNIPTQITDEILYAGKGIQVMLVYNH